MNEMCVCVRERERERAHKKELQNKDADLGFPVRIRKSCRIRQQCGLGRKRQRNRAGLIGFSLAGESKKRLRLFVGKLLGQLANLREERRQRERSYTQKKGVKGFAVQKKGVTGEGPFNPISQMNMYENAESKKAKIHPTVAYN